MSINHWLVSAALTVDRARQPAADFRPVGDITDKWQAVIEAMDLSPEELATAAATYFDLERADFSRLEPEFASQLPESVARTHMVVPIIADGKHALVAMIDPADVSTQDELSFTLGMPVRVCIATPQEIEAMLADVYTARDETLEGWGSVTSSMLADDLVLRGDDGSAIATGTSATSKLLVELLKRAVRLNASDIHIQPYGEGAVVRNRIDGVLYRSVELPASVHDHLVRHVKAISGMDVTRHMIPQDGELRMEVSHQEIDLRLSVLPVSGSERLVARLLPQNQVRALGMLRLEPAEQQRLERISQSTDGMILMTGPTGSGKTSLLYAMLAEKNTPDINIMTVEEPVEYRLRGASQINVDTRTGLTFAKSLRSILRQDPDVVMIGEIRDEETAQIAAQAALTGHFVLSTVHTLDALLALVRMADLGVSSVSLADALHAVASQRLVRALCEHCKVAISEDEMSADEQQFSRMVSPPRFRAVGCEHCHSTGMSGRVPVLEIIEITDEMRRLLRADVQDLDQMETLAVESGTRFLAEGFAARVAQGTTTVAEVIRVYGRGFFSRLKHFNNLRQMAGQSTD